MTAVTRATSLTGIPTAWCGGVGGGKPVGGYNCGRWMRLCLLDAIVFVVFNRIQLCVVVLCGGSVLLVGNRIVDA